MESTLPFEYGVMYRVIPSPTSEDRSEIERTYYQEDILKPSYSIQNPSYSYSGTSPLNSWVDTQMIVAEGMFLPIAFKESTQKVIVEIIVSENEKTAGILQLDNNQFKYSEITRHSRRVRRIELDVNLFIRNFEKVL